MQQAKIFEIRDRGTFIPVMAVKLGSHNPFKPNWQIEEDYLIRRVGFSDDVNYVLLTILSSLETNYEPTAWTSERTIGNAHKYILDNFDILKGGEVVDIEYILGETKELKVSERLEKYSK